MKTVEIERMSWTDFEEAMKETDVVIIPTGVMEEHGPHIPLGTDTIIAEHCAKLIGEKARIPVAPVMTHGYAANVRSFPGSTSLDPDTYRALMLAYCESLIRHGAKRFLIVSGHGGNTPVLDILAGDLYDRYGVVTFANDWWSVLPQLNPEYNCKDHGGYFETSMLMAAREDLTDMSMATAVGQCAISGGIRKAYTWKFKAGTIGIHCDVKKFNPYGNLGNPPEGASKALGEAMTQMYVDFNVALLDEMKKIPM